MACPSLLPRRRVRYRPGHAEASASSAPTTGAGKLRHAQAGAGAASSASALLRASALERGSAPALPHRSGRPRSRAAPPRASPSRAGEAVPDDVATRVVGHVGPPSRARVQLPPRLQRGPAHAIRERPRPSQQRLALIVDGVGARRDTTPREEQPGTTPVACSRASGAEPPERSTSTSTGTAPARTMHGAQAEHLDERRPAPPTP
ncbi:uncharacterized protein LOC125507555 [Triticum urartu]|uniref:uncharacterized protein LOC125507555 n=1 Tax=Triticum urartu TaxID=4572 RepID=UPI00204353C9|nr:uncharacterized protein LOC125507555 [Triticum urartu]